LAAPILGRNINNPHLIAYFNHDEGFLMDLLWYHFSGDKRASFQYESDYGVELLYLSDLSRIFLSKFVKLTPGFFVQMLRWLHLSFWVAALLALWRLVCYHFQRYWQALVAILFLALSPAFPYLLQNSKPEPVVLFFMILGLDYVLRIIDRPSWKNLLIAISCASLATLVKFAGIFLIPVIIAAMYFGRKNKDNQLVKLLNKKMGGVFPAVIGSIFIALPLLLIFGYRRQTTGLSWFEEFGLINSLLRLRPILYSLVAGGLLIAFSFFLKSRGRHLKKACSRIEHLLSYGLVVFSLFILVSLLFGFRWILNPRNFIQSLATSGIEATINTASFYKVGALLAFFKHFLSRIGDFGIFVFVLLFFYLLMEVWLRYKRVKLEQSGFYKRITLGAFVLLGVICMPLPLRFSQHHMLPFFIFAVVLVTEGIKLLHAAGKRYFWLKQIILPLVVFAFSTQLILNSISSFRTFGNMYRWKEDVIFDVARWWSGRYSPQTPIIADHPVYAYLPAEYKNVTFLKFKEEKTEQLRNLVDSKRPQLVYYNSGTDESDTVPPLEEILPNKRVKLVASFDSSGKSYRRYPDSRFLIYEVKN